MRQLISNVYADTAPWAMHKRNLDLVLERLTAVGSRLYWSLKEGYIDKSTNKQLPLLSFVMDSQ